MKSGSIIQTESYKNLNIFYIKNFNEKKSPKKYVFNSTKLQENNDNCDFFKNKENDEKNSNKNKFLLLVFFYIKKM
jgi:hypothetical protein